MLIGGGLALVFGLLLLTALVMQQQRTIEALQARLGADEPTEA